MKPMLFVLLALFWLIALGYLFLGTPSKKFVYEKPVSTAAESVTAKPLARRSSEQSKKASIIPTESVLPLIQSQPIPTKPNQVRSTNDEAAVSDTQANVSQLPIVEQETAPLKRSAPRPAPVTVKETKVDASKPEPQKKQAKPTRGLPLEGTIWHGHQWQVFNPDDPKRSEGGRAVIKLQITEQEKNHFQGQLTFVRFTVPDGTVYRFDLTVSIHGTIEGNKLTYSPFKLIQNPYRRTFTLDSTSKATITGQTLRGTYQDANGGHGRFELKKTRN